MLEEKLHLLEEKVAALLDELKRVRKENTAQRQEIQTLAPKAEQVGSLEKENARLQKQVLELEEALSSGDEKEEQIRERLRGIIEKIDALEALSDGE